MYLHLRVLACELCRAVRLCAVPESALATHREPGTYRELARAVREQPVPLLDLLHLLHHVRALGIGEHHWHTNTHTRLGTSAPMHMGLAVKVLEYPKCTMGVSM